MSTDQPNLLDLAKQGNAHAISNLMNRHLNSKGVNAKAVVNGDCLQILLESSQTPNQKVFVPFIQKGVTGLSLVSIRTLRIYGRQIGAKVPSWSQEIVLMDTEEPDELGRNLSKTVKEEKHKSPIYNYKNVIKKYSLKLNDLLKKTRSKFGRLPINQKIILTLSALLILYMGQGVWDGYRKVEMAKYGSTNRLKKAIAEAIQKVDEAGMRRILLVYENPSERQEEIKKQCAKYFKNLNENKGYYDSDFLKNACESYR